MEEKKVRMVIDHEKSVLVVESAYIDNKFVKSVSDGNKLYKKVWNKKFQ